MKKRMVNTCFWDDGFIEKLPRDARYLFLYLLTNHRTNIVGIYEISINSIAKEAGFSSEEEVCENLKLIEKKILFVDGWVCIKNFTKHQASDSPRIADGIKRAMSEVPAEIASIFKAFKDSGNTPSSSFKEFEAASSSLKELEGAPCNSNSNSNNNHNRINAENGVGKEIGDYDSDGPNQILSAFYAFNPMINFANKAYRRDAEALIKKFGLQEAMSLALLAISVQGRQFAPVITDPSALIKKLGALRSFVSRGDDKPKSRLTTV